MNKHTLNDCIKDIPQLPFASYKIDLWWGRLEWWMKRMEEGYGLDMNPDFQQGHVWTEDQQIAYCEWIMKGGFSGKDIFFNSPYWMSFKHDDHSTLVIIDGKQRIDAVLSFLHNKIKVFGHYIDKYKDKKIMLHSLDLGFKVHINNIVDKVDILKWYLSMNEGGTVHSFGI